MAYLLAPVSPLAQQHQGAGKGVAGIGQWRARVAEAPDPCCPGGLLEVLGEPTRCQTGPAVFDLLQARFWPSRRPVRCVPTPCRWLGILCAGLQRGVLTPTLGISSRAFVSSGDWACCAAPELFCSDARVGFKSLRGGRRFRNQVELPQAGVSPH